MNLLFWIYMRLFIEKALEKGACHMAIQKQLDMLKQGSKIWNTWRVQQPGVSIDLTGTNFSTSIIGFTTLGNVDLSTTKGLDKVEHRFPSTIGIDTIYQSHWKIPEVFLREAGVQESFIDVMKLINFQPLEYSTCFISYSNKDKEFAERLYADLKQKGVRCWFAPHSLKIGADFQTILKKRS